MIKNVVNSVDTESYFRLLESSLFVLQEMSGFSGRSPFTILVRDSYNLANIHCTLNSYPGTTDLGNSSPLLG